MIEKASDAFEPRLSVAEGLDLVLLSQDELLVQFGSRSLPSELLRDRDRTGILGAMLGRLLNGPATMGELLGEVGAEHQVEAGALIKDLLQRGILSDLDRNPVEQYLRYTFSGDCRLGDRTVTLIGAGPLGARIAHTLLQHGIGRLTLLDDREPDNLWGAFLPLASRPAGDVDGPVHRLLRDRLIAAGHATVECLEAGLDIAGVDAGVTRSDLTVVALEQPHLRLGHLVNRCCIRHRRPWLLATIDGNFGLVGPLFQPVHTACYNDYRALADSATPSPLMARRHRQHVLRRGAGSFFTGLPAYAEIVAGHAALAAVQFLLRDTCFALARVLAIDFDRMRIDVEDVLKLPRCPVCGTEKAAYRPLFPAEIVAGP